MILNISKKKGVFMFSLNQSGAYYGHGVSWWTSQRLYMTENQLKLY